MSPVHISYLAYTCETPPLHYCNHVRYCSVQGAIGRRYGILLVAILYMCSMYLVCAVREVPTSLAAGVCQFRSGWYEWGTAKGSHHCGLHRRYCGGERSGTVEEAPAGVRLLLGGLNEQCIRKCTYVCMYVWGLALYGDMVAWCAACKLG